MFGASEANHSPNNRASRVSLDPFSSPPSHASDEQNSCHTATASTDPKSDGKENRVPLIDSHRGHPNITMRRRSRKLAGLSPCTSDSELSAAPFLLGKRPATYTPSNRPTETQEDDIDDNRRQRDSLAAFNAVAHFEARALALHAESLSFTHESGGTDFATVLVDDYSHVQHLHFGSVALGDCKSRQLTLKNAKESGNARVKYDGYVLLHRTSASVLTKTRFKCDLHVCVVDALKAVSLRLTFEPHPTDVGRQITAMLRFTVNDNYKLQCRATAEVVPRVPMIPVGNRGIAIRDTIFVASKKRRHKRQEERARQVAFTVPLTLASRSSIDRELEQEASGVNRLNVGDKRRSSVAIDISPPQNGLKRRKSEPLKASTPHKSAEKPMAERSWWKNRQIAYDENWIAKQTIGFTKWINYVLLDGDAERLSGDAQDEDEEQRAGKQRRFEFSSLRELAQKRLESKWTHAAVKLYQSPSMEDILFNLQDEIGNKGLLFRADCPVYADVGLQEELISLLNNYHPVWLCLGLYAVLGTQVMREERCSLRAIFRATSGYPKHAKNESTNEGRMPQVLRRLIVKHLIKDAHVAQNYRLVQHLMAPMDGSTTDRHDGGNAFMNTKKNINGREYFDSLTQSFMLKFFMLVMFLDRAIERKRDAFAHFPCLFRLTPRPKKPVVHTAKLTDNRQDERVKVKKSQVFVMEFCRLFLTSEGRIDKHLKLLGYTLQYEQTPLDEIDLEVTNLETDLRDGVRLAKLIEVLTTRPVCSNNKDEISGTTRSLSTFLRVPALSRLQKVHNVEICLHFLQDTWGPSVLDLLQRSGKMADAKCRVNGRVCVSSSGFAGLQSRVNEVMVNSLAKDIVSGQREQTLALLWRLISCFQLQALVDASTMRQEIAHVVKRMSFRASNHFKTQQQIAPLNGKKGYEGYTLLLEWCRAVCANYDVKVCDFSSSFADGKALCYLVHYYHPMLLLKSDVLPTTSDARDGKSKGLSEKSLLLNEQRNFAIVNDRIKQLGNVPVLMPQQCNSKNPPEDKMMVTFVCYLQSRLMESCSEIHAASRLKRWWHSPWIRLRLCRQKNRSARVVQRFWYTSSQKRLAIRQCRKLLRAAYTVKCTVQTGVTQRRFLRLKRSLIVLQRAFRARQLVSGYRDVDEAATVIQRLWRNRLEGKRKQTRQALERRQLTVALQGQVRASCAVIEKHWLQYLSREGARLVRQQVIADRWAAASAIQAAWRLCHWRDAARKQRQDMWRQHHHFARVLQRAWTGVQKRRAAMRQRVAFKRLAQLMRDHELHIKRRKLKQKVETRAATCVQKGFRMFTWRRQKAAAIKVASVFRGSKQRQHFKQQKEAANTLQRNVRVWRQRRHFLALTQLYKMLLAYQQIKISKAHERSVRLHELKKLRATCRVQTAFRRYRLLKRMRAATRIQAIARGWTLMHWYGSLRQSARLVQKNVRVWRRRNQLHALLSFQKMLLRYRRLQVEEQQRLEQLRQQRLGRLHERVEHRAATRIQSVLRCYADYKRKLAATRLQAACRGFMDRLRYTSTYASVVVTQRAARAWVARTRLQRSVRLQCAAVCIQRHFRGWRSRRLWFHFHSLTRQLQRLHLLVSCWQIEWWYRACTEKFRKKRTLMARAHWTRLCSAMLQKRRTNINRIVACWRSSYLRRNVNRRVEHTRRRNGAAQRMQVWWLKLCCKWSERKRRVEMKRHWEMEEMALTMARVRAERVIALWLWQTVVAPFRVRKTYVKAVQRAQAWWRGALVRLHHCTAEITQQRKKLSTMRLVDHESLVQTNSSSKSLKHLRIEVRGETSTEPATPQTLGTRLDRALHMLLYGARLQDMLFASYTIEVCTRYSRECCRKCVQLRIASTIFGAIRGLNRSRPHVELLHQLLLVLRNLTMYRRSADKSQSRSGMSTKEAKKRLEMDLRAVDTLVDLLHIHRDMHHVFVLSAKVIMYYLERLWPLVSTQVDVHESWSGAEKRLNGLRELLARKLALHNATASFRRVNRMSDDPSAANNLMRKMDPKTAVSIMEQIVHLLER